MNPKQPLQMLHLMLHLLQMLLLLWQMPLQK
jgi:hypothetical protein